MTWLCGCRSLTNTTAVSHALELGNKHLGTHKSLLGVSRSTLPSEPLPAKQDGSPPLVVDGVSVVTGNFHPAF